MKNFTLFLSAAMLMGASASAAGLAQMSTNAHSAKLVQVEKTQKSPSFTLKNTPRELDLSKMTTQRPARSRAAKDIVVDPQGQTKSYMLTAWNWSNSWFGLSLDEETMMTEVVWGSNNEVYIKNIVDIGIDNWIKGTYKDGKIRVDFPQTVFYDEEIVEVEVEVEGEDGEVEVEIEEQLYIVQYDYNVCNLEVYDREDKDGPYQTLDYVIAEQSENYVIYNVDEESGTITLDLTEWEFDPDMYDDYSLLPGKILGLTVQETGYEEGWTGYGAVQQEYVPFGYEITQLPEGLEPEKWIMSYTDIDGDEQVMQIQVAIDDEHIYLGGFDEMVEGWAKGRIMGNTVSFPSEQYLGFIDWYQVPIFFMTAKITDEIEVDPETGEEWLNPVANFTSGILFKYDAEGKRLETYDHKTTIVLNASLEELYYLDMYTAPTIYLPSAEMLNAAPLTPSMFYFLPWSTENYGGQGEMVWDIPAVNVNGVMLDTDRMYYNLYFDGEQTCLDPDEYPEVEEELWDIPYEYTDWYDIQVSGERHYIWFNVDGVETYGCQSFYIGSDGVTYASEMGIYVDGQTGIDGVKDFSKVMSTTYFDLSGRQVSNPETGLYIKSMKLENGKVLNVKVSIK